MLTPSYFRNINPLLINNGLVYIASCKFRKKRILKFFRVQAANYARWQLLLGELSVAAASLDNGWDIIHKIKYPSTTVSEATRLACVQAVESAMPFAIARPFVEEFIPDEVINRVSNKHCNWYQ